MSNRIVNAPGNIAKTTLSRVSSFLRYTTFWAA